jgi:hypothetical protein
VKNDTLLGITVSAMDAFMEEREGRRGKETGM